MDIVAARKILGITANTTGEDIKKAYRKRAMELHPDRGGDEEDFKKLQEALDVYDSFLLPKHQIMADVYVSVPVASAFSGGSLNVMYDRRLITVDYPPITRPGFLVSKYINDRDVIVAVKPDNYFDIDWGNNGSASKGDMHSDLSISPFLMITGGWFEYPLFSGGTHKIRIPAGCGANSRVKIQNKGYWKNIETNARGDLYLKIIPCFKPLREYSYRELQEFIDACAHAQKNLPLPVAPID